MALDRERLVKLLGMTESKYDAEALGAIRRSNALLREHKVTWAELLAGAPEPGQAREPFQARRRQRPRPRPAGFAAEPMRAPRMQPRYRTASAAAPAPPDPLRQAWAILRWLFFPIAVFGWLYARVVHTARWWLKPVAMVVPLFGAAAAAVVWAILLLSAVQLIGMA
jgi:hypothetical protein